MTNESQIYAVSSGAPRESAELITCQDSLPGGILRSQHLRGDECTRHFQCYFSPPFNPWGTAFHKIHIHAEDLDASSERASLSAGVVWGMKAKEGHIDV